MRQMMRTVCLWALGVAVVVFPGALEARAADYAEPGPYPVGWQRVEVTRPGGGSFTALLYYPAEEAGENAALDRTGGPYPAVSFGHGFLQPPSRYRSILEHLASWGYLTIATESALNLFPNHAAYAVDLRLCLTFLADEHERDGSWLEGAVDTGAFGLSGHSMGGGASMLAAAADERIGAVATLAPANTNPSAIAAAADVTAPVRLIVGSSDSITPTGNHGEPMYENGAGPRQLVDIEGAWHCGFQDTSIIGCDSGPMSRADQLELSRRLLTEFFELHLRGDQAVWARVWGPELGEDPRVTVRSEATVEVEPDDAEVRVRPGFEARVGVEVRNRGPVATSFSLEAGSGALVVSGAGAIGTVEPSSDGSGVVALVAEGEPGDEGAVLISARRDVDGGVRGFAVVQARVFCPADINTDGEVDVEDFFAYLTLFEAGDAGADFTGAGDLSVADFFAFLDAFAAGC